MIEARHTFAGELVARIYSGYKLEQVFRSVRFHIAPVEADMPVLLLSNHFCWWDGFIQHRLNRQYYHRRFHVMMLEEQLRKYPILNGCGAFSIQKNSRGILNSLNYCTELLQDNSNLLLLFPQGKIESLNSPSIHFEKGLDYILKHTSHPFQMIFNINLIDFFSNRKPDLFVYTSAYDHRTRALPEIEIAFNRFFHHCKKQQENICR